MIDSLEVNDNLVSVVCVCVCMYVEVFMFAQQLTA